MIQQVLRIKQMSSDLSTVVTEIYYDDDEDKPVHKLIYIQDDNTGKPKITLDNVYFTTEEFMDFIDAYAQHDNVVYMNEELLLGIISEHLF